MWIKNWSDTKADNVHIQSELLMSTTNQEKEVLDYSETKP